MELENRYSLLYGAKACVGKLHGCFEAMKAHGDRGRKFKHPCVTMEMQCLHSEAPLEAIRRVARQLVLQGSGYKRGYRTNVAQV
jgi:hypothetical protein